MSVPEKTQLEESLYRVSLGSNEFYIVKFTFEKVTCLTCKNAPLRFKKFRSNFEGLRFQDPSSNFEDKRRLYNIVKFDQHWSTYFEFIVHSYSTTLSVTSAKQLQPGHFLAPSYSTFLA